MKAKRILIATGILLLFACNNEDSVESINFEDSAYGVVGRWYTEKTDNPELDMFAEYTFTTDGAVYVDEYRRRNGYKRDEERGTYSIDGNRIVSNMASNKGLPIQSGSELLNLNSLTFTTRSKDYGNMQFLRIVGIVTTHVGDTIHLNVQQAVDSYTSQNVKVISYSMTDEAIASIDDEGVLTPKLIGVTYLKIETSIGNAALKISVSDEQNLWNDFSQGLGKSFDEVEKIFGKHYAFKSDSMRYFYDNPYVDSVDIYRHYNIVDSIVMTFKDNVEESEIIYYIDKKLAYVDDTLSYRWYTDNENYLLSKYSAKLYKSGKNKKFIYTYIEPDWDDRRYDYGLDSILLKEKYGMPNQVGNTVIGYFYKKDFISQIAYTFNPTVRNGTVLKYAMYLNSYVTPEMANDYLSRKYNYCSNIIRPYEYGRNIRIDDKEFIMFVEYERSDHKLWYNFKQFK
jgi:hypothetical protein